MCLSFTFLVILGFIFPLASKQGVSSVWESN
jgi:hypothetical protein